MPGTNIAHRDLKRLYARANLLALITIFYNIVEGLFSVGFGLADETFALFGFGVDSCVEVISGIGVWHMLRRIRAADASDSDRFERRALKVTGTAFYLLAAGLIVTGVANLVQGHQPETAFWGIVISMISIFTMGALIAAKVKVGRALGSAAILADAACTRTCLWLSVVLLAASAGYAFTGIGYIDTAGALVIAVFAGREGREAFAQASGQACGECHE